MTDKDQGAFIYLVIIMSYEILFQKLLILPVKTFKSFKTKNLITLVTREMTSISNLIILF